MSNNKKPLPFRGTEQTGFQKKPPVRQTENNICTIWAPHWFWLPVVPACHPQPR